MLIILLFFILNTVPETVPTSCIIILDCLQVTPRARLVTTLCRQYTTSRQTSCSPPSASSRGSWASARPATSGSSPSSTPGPGTPWLHTICTLWVFKRLNCDYTSWSFTRNSIKIISTLALSSLLTVLSDVLSWSYQIHTTSFDQRRWNIFGV